MNQDAFTKLKPQEVHAILERINPLFESTPFDSDDTTIMVQDMPFYPGCRYLDIADFSSPAPIRNFVIENNKKYTLLDWTNKPIYELNKELPIHLDETTAPDYVRFFLSHVRGEKGRFLVAENIDDIRWRDDPPPTARKSISKMLQYIEVTKLADDGAFILPMTVMFKDALFACEAHLTPDGTLTIQNEEILIEDIPVLDDVLGQ